MPRATHIQPSATGARQQRPGYVHHSKILHHSLIGVPCSVFNSSYTFSAKERDLETGYSYFGARYYSSNLSVWLSVDPKSDQGPWISPYAYAFHNPMVFVDPDGEWPKYPESVACAGLARRTGWNIRLAMKKLFTLDREAQIGVRIANKQTSTSASEQVNYKVVPLSRYAKRTMCHRSKNRLKNKHNYDRGNRSTVNQRTVENENSSSSNISLSSGVLGGSFPDIAITFDRAGNMSAFQLLEWQPSMNSYNFTEAARQIYGLTRDHEPVFGLNSIDANPPGSSRTQTVYPFPVGMRTDDQVIIHGDKNIQILRNGKDITQDIIDANH